MAVERTYNIPLRKAFLRAPKYKRAKKAVTELKIFLKRHMKSDSIRIGKFLNQKIWEHGIKNPPHHVKVNAVKEDDGSVKAELFGMPKEEKKQERKQKSQKKEGKKAEKKEITKIEAAAEEKKEEEKKEFPEQEKKREKILGKEPTKKTAKVRQENRKKE